MWPFKTKAERDLDIMNLVGKETISCRGCHALLWEKNAVKGKSVVAEHLTWIGERSYGPFVYIDTPYYCVKCAPIQTAGEAE